MTISNKQYTTDEILVMDEGRITDRGTHAELIEREGFYRDIFRYQSEKMDQAS